MTLVELTADFTAGLEATTRAIYNADKEVFSKEDFISVCGTDYVTFSENSDAQGRSRFLANFLRSCANRDGWLAGWRLLARPNYQTGMDEEMMEDIKTGVEIFDEVDVTTEHKPVITDIDFKVVANSAPATLHEVGPKTIGGHAWQTDESYKRACSAWALPQEYWAMAPCTFFAWLGICKKVFPSNDQSVLRGYWLAQLLGTVDYDMDLDGKFRETVEAVVKIAVETTGHTRSVALTGLLTMDQQTYNRQVMYKWVAEKKGPFLTGPKAISPLRFIRATIADSAALAPFAFRPNYIAARKGMFIAVVNSNCHDFIYDIGSSSRISTVGFAYSTNSLRHDIPQAFVVSALDAVAKLILHGPADQEVDYGVSTMIAAGLWNLFNVRYRTWERFVKYTRLLRTSSAEAAKVILRNAEENKVFPPLDWNDDLEASFNQCLDPENSKVLIHRTSYTAEYKVHIDGDTLAANGVSLLPDNLCGTCKEKLSQHLYREDATVQAIKDIPPALFFKNIPLMMTATFSRGCVWATTDACCGDACALVVAAWAMDNSDRVTVASMETENVLSVKDWLLECYLVGCFSFSPLRIMSILGGFDAFVDVKFETGAMGPQRDIVDC